MRKKAKEAKIYKQTLGDLQCAYTKKQNDLSLELNKAVLEAF